MQKSSKQTSAGLSYWTYGDPKDPALLMVHGFTGSHEGFEYIIDNLTGYYVIVPDLPGFGVSPLTLPCFTIGELARAANSFMKSLGLSKAPHLIAHSMGGLVAASMLAQSPELYDPRAILISPVATKVQYLDSRKVGELLGRLQFFLGKTVPGVGPKLVKSRLISRVSTAVMLTADQPALKQKIRNHHFKNLDYISSIDYYYQLHVDINKKGAIDYAPEINKKFNVLIITGDTDVVTPLPTQKKLAAALTNCTINIIKDVGHLLHYERSKEVAAAIVDFLS